MASNEALIGEITQPCPAVHPPSPESTQNSTVLAWKGLLATSAVVMAVGGAAVGVNSLQADTRTLYTEVIHLAANRPSLPGSSPAVGPVAATERPIAQAAALPQVQAPVAVPVTSDSSASQDSKVAASDRKNAIDEPVNGSVIDDDYVRVTGHVDPSVKGDLFVLVFPERAPGRGWPQTSDASRGVPAVRVGDTFRVPAFLGGPAQIYDIAVYETSKDASRRLAAYLQQVARTGKHPGISTVDMPAGMQELARVTVRTTRSNL